jgi:hypothetical protein
MAARPIRSALSVAPLVFIKDVLDLFNSPKTAVIDAPAVENTRHTEQIRLRGVKVLDHVMARDLAARI